MVDPRIERLAKLCVHYSVEVKPKEKVVIRGKDGEICADDEPFYKDGKFLI